MEFIALVLIVVAGFVGWSAGRDHGRSEVINKSRDDKKTTNEKILEEFNSYSYSSSRMNIKYINYPIVNPDSGPLVLIKAVDLISLSAESQQYMSGGDPSDGSHHQDSLRVIADIYLSESRGITDAERAYVVEYFK